jgi:hypothetical protein
MAAFGYGHKYDFTKRYIWADVVCPIRLLLTHTRLRPSLMSLKKTIVVSDLVKVEMRCNVLDPCQL